MGDVRRRGRRKDSGEMIDENIWRTSEEVGVELRRIREERGWTLADVEEHDPYLRADRLSAIEAGSSTTANELVHFDELYGVTTRDITIRPDAPASERVKIERRTLELYEDMYELMADHDLYCKDLTSEQKERRLARLAGEIEDQRRRVMELEAQLALETLAVPVVHGVKVEQADTVAELEAEVVRGA